MHLIYFSQKYLVQESDQLDLTLMQEMLIFIRDFQSIMKNFVTNWWTKF